MEAARELLDLGADVNVENSRGTTPLHFAAGAKARAREMCQLLLDCGADTGVSDLQGKLPYEMAESDDIRCVPGWRGVGRLLMVAAAGLAAVGALAVHHCSWRLQMPCPPRYCPCGCQPTVLHACPTAAGRCWMAPTPASSPALHPVTWRGCASCLRRCAALGDWRLDALTALVACIALLLCSGPAGWLAGSCLPAC